jgi:ribosome biogenesis GTPase A
LNEKDLKMKINWYPGHMAKAKRLINENLKLVDMVIELLDARIPRTSTNPDFQKMFQNKIRIVILNKSDYADAQKTAVWQKFYEEQGVKVIVMNALNRQDIKQARRALFAIADEKRKEIKERKGINKTIRGMVAGIPNVGKSTFINSFAGSGKAKTGDRPGVTKAKQWVRVTPFFELLDTPGLLWPRLDDKHTGLHLAYTGAIKEEILDLEEVAHHFLEEIASLYPQFLRERYSLEDLNKKGFELLEAVSVNRSWLKSGGVPDTQRGAKQILDEFQSGQLGRITLELP